MYISEFNYHVPTTIEEASSLFLQSGDCALLAGGTDLLVEIKKGLRFHKDIISLSRIEELKTITSDSENIYIGACAAHNEVMKSKIIVENFPSISEAASKIGTDQIRNSGTVGGNLCTGASCCDMAPILAALDAKVEIFDGKKRTLSPIRDFFVDHHKTILKKGEILTKIILPLSKKDVWAKFEKFGLREAASISVASVAIAIDVKDDVCNDVCVVMGAVAPIPIISKTASEMLTGKKVSEIISNPKIIEEARDAAANDALPIDDIRGSKNYRRNVIKTLTKRTLANLLIDNPNSTIPTDKK